MVEGVVVVLVVEVLVVEVLIDPGLAHLAHLNANTIYLKLNYLAGIVTIDKITNIIMIHVSITHLETIIQHNKIRNNLLIQNKQLIFTK